MIALLLAGLIEWSVVYQADSTLSGRSQPLTETEPFFVYDEGNRRDYYMSHDESWIGFVDYCTDVPQHGWYFMQSNCTYHGAYFSKGEARDAALHFIETGEPPPESKSVSMLWIVIGLLCCAVGVYGWVMIFILMWHGTY